MLGFISCLSRDAPVRCTGVSPGVSGFRSHLLALFSSPRSVTDDRWGQEMASPWFVIPGMESCSCHFLGSYLRKANNHHSCVPDFHKILSLTLCLSPPACQAAQYPRALSQGHAGFLNSKYQGLPHQRTLLNLTTLFPFSSSSQESD